jgi:protein-L-isoaspartate(D-aspartate) O-methyltransferase
MFVITGESPAMEARLMTRQDVTEWSVESLFETDMPELVHAAQEPKFEF